MIKRDELGDPNSCLNRASDDEMLFVLRAHDVAAPKAIEMWAQIRIAMGKSRLMDPEILAALDCADKMMEQQGAQKKAAG